MSHGQALQILIVDDQHAMRDALEMLFEAHGLPALCADGPEAALSLIRSEHVGLVIQDMNFAEGETSGRGGVELFRAIRALDADLPVLLMTAWTSLETAVTLMREGAADYFAKPWNDEKLLASVQTLLRMRELAYDNARLRSRAQQSRRALAERHDLCGLTYESDVMHELVGLAVKVAPSDAPVLITGPNGSGKDKLADVVWANSRRRGKPFVKLNAGGLPEQLLEAELFGAEAGAFTGATKLRIGRFEAAHGGTLFLDELGNLSLNGQMKLLRVLQTGEFERVGSNTTRKVDVRVLSATNTNLLRAIAAGSFREDLYFRLNAIELAMPALFDRTDDIVPLATRFLSEGAQPPPRLSEDAIETLLAHDWPGNVRELQNRLQRATLVCQDGVIRAADLALGDGERRRREPAAVPTVAAAREKRASPLDAPEDRERIVAALARAKGVVSKAAVELGLSRQALYRRMVWLGMSVERQVKE
jgi:DNA-binding NtrC family response regulator